MSNGTLCPANEDGQHNFQSYVTATLPPETLALQVALGAHNYTSEAVARIVDSLTAKRHMIACRDCGKVIGGFCGVEPPVVEVEGSPKPEPPPPGQGDSLGPTGA